MKRNYIRRILAAFMAAAVMSSFAAVSIYAEPDMVVDDEADVEYVEDEEQEDSEQETTPDEDEEADTAPDETEDEEGEAPDVDPNAPTDNDLAEGEAPSLPEPTYTPTGDIKMYATTTINIRKGPGTGYDKLGVLYAGSDTTVKGYNGEWMAIDYYGGTGYVLGELLTETAPATTTTTAAPPVETAPEVVETEETSAETEPVIEDTTAPEEEPIVTTSEETAPTTKPAEDSEDEDKDEAAAVTDSSDKKSGGLQGILIAAISALVAFILIGVLPVVIHRIHHKKLYQY